MREAFPGWELEFVNGSRSERLERPFRITFPPLKEEEAEGGSKGKRKAGEAADGEAGGAAAAPARKLVVESYTPRDPGPYPEDLPPQNSVRFTPVQTQAIMSGVQPGLTMVVGPPGGWCGGGREGRRAERQWCGLAVCLAAVLCCSGTAHRQARQLPSAPRSRPACLPSLLCMSPAACAGTGKTDTAVQIMHILYHNCPSQRTLVVTHSNQALNDLFTKASRGGRVCCGK